VQRVAGTARVSGILRRLLSGNARDHFEEPHAGAAGHARLRCARTETARGGRGLGLPGPGARWAHSLAARGPYLPVLSLPRFVGMGRRPGLAGWAGLASVMPEEVHGMGHCPCAVGLNCGETGSDAAFARRVSSARHSLTDVVHCPRQLPLPMWLWVLEIAVLLVFVGFGGFEGFIAWAVLTALFLFGQHVRNQAQLKAAELLLRGEQRQAEERRERERELRVAHPPLLTPARTANPLPSADRRCAGCGSVTPGDAKFCDACGRTFSTDCARCGAANRDGARFCNKCGDTLASEPAPTPRAAAAISVPIDLPPIASAPTSVRLAKLIRPVECRACGTINRGDAYQCTNCRDILATLTWTCACTTINPTRKTRCSNCGTWNPE